jgi:hypothetical protein
MYNAFVYGRDLDAARDIVHIHITSLWFLSNILRQIATEWVFQLNADATFGFCGNAVIWELGICGYVWISRHIRTYPYKTATYV